MAKKKMTIEDLAVTVKGLAGTVDNLAVITQKGFLDLGTELRSEMREGFKDVDIDLTKVKHDVILLKADMLLERQDSKEIKEGTSKLLTQLDHSVGSTKKQEQEQVFLSAQVRRLETCVDKLEAKK